MRSRRAGSRAGTGCASTSRTVSTFSTSFSRASDSASIFVPINVLYREREIAHMVADAEPRFSISTADYRALFGDHAVVDVETIAAEASSQSADRVRLTIDGDEPAAIVYTSGTTGRSKGAVLSHNNFAANATGLVSCWRITSEDRYLAVLPLFHVHGLGNGVCSWLVSGCRMRLAERFDAQRAEALFDSFQPTLFFGVPTIDVRLLELPAEAAQAHRQPGAAVRFRIRTAAGRRARRLSRAVRPHDPRALRHE